jgi:hypothetical protein
MQIQPIIDITQIIVAIITAIGVIIAAIITARQRRMQRESPRPEGEPRRINTWTILMVVCITLLAANLVVFVLRPRPEVEITYPDDGANVEIREIVRGTSQKIPKGQAIWIIVYPYLVDRYYPQNNSADVQVNGDWTSLTSIGIEEDVNRKFDIIAVLADKRAQDAFNAYFTKAKDTNTWPGLERLLEGATIYDRITVMRK